MRTFLFMLLLCSVACSSPSEPEAAANAAPAPDEYWDNYIAYYENERPGSVMLRMDLINQAPIKGFEQVIITGVQYASDRPDGFPVASTMDTLYQIEEAVTAIIKQSTEVIFAGAFTFEKERLAYFYVQEVGDLKEQLANFYTSNYPQYQSILSIEEDANWGHYLEFLYPNEETLSYMNDSKVIENLKRAGDQLDQARRIDFWLYFPSKALLESCKEELLPLGFSVEKIAINEQSDLQHELQIYKSDVVNINSIYSTTSELRTLAQKYQGSYDGWETVVIK
ncbi:MAG: DUF695 domain-containing protein [Bacteroidota bacterium]